MKTVALELMDVMLGLFHAFPHQNALALLVDLEHMKLRLFSGPSENLLKDMRDIIHEIHWVVPANHKVTRLQPRFRLFFGFYGCSGPDFRSSFDHMRKLEETAALV